MADLTTALGRLELKNPVIAGSGTETGNAKLMSRALEAGVAAVVGKTVTFDAFHQSYPRPRFHLTHRGAIGENDCFSLYSAELMAAYKPEDWSREIRETARVASREDAKVIASIAGRDLGEWCKLAVMMEDAGADMIELNTSCPHVTVEAMGRNVGSSPDASFEVIESVRESTSLPVMAKLTPEAGNLVPVAVALEKAGVDCLAVMARFRALILDIEKKEPILWRSYGGYGGPWMVPLGLRWVSEVAAAVRTPICGAPGISTWRDVVSYLMVGARAAQVVTAAIVNGYQAYDRMIRGLESYMDKQGFSKTEEMIGNALDKIVPFREIAKEEGVTAEIDESLCTGCRICEASCFCNAIRWVPSRKVAQIHPNRCDGCGLCATRCPAHAVSMGKAR